MADLTVIPKNDTFYLYLGLHGTLDSKNLYQVREAAAPTKNQALLIDFSFLSGISSDCGAAFLELIACHKNTILIGRLARSIEAALKVKKISIGFAVADHMSDALELIGLKGNISPPLRTTRKLNPPASVVGKATAVFAKPAEKKQTASVSVAPQQDLLGSQTEVLFDDSPLPLVGSQTMIDLFLPQVQSSAVSGEPKLHEIARSLQTLSDNVWIIRNAIDSLWHKVESLEKEQHALRALPVVLNSLQGSIESMQVDVVSLAADFNRRSRC